MRLSLYRRFGRTRPTINSIAPAVGPKRTNSPIRSVVIGRYGALPRIATGSPRYWPHFSERESQSSRSELKPTYRLRLGTIGYVENVRCQCHSLRQCRSDLAFFGGYLNRPSGELTSTSRCF